MASRRVLGVRVADGRLGAGAGRLRRGTHADRRGDPRARHLDRSDRRGTPARARQRQGRRAALSLEGMRGMPRRVRHRRHGADSEKQESRESRRLGAGAHPAASRAVRDHGLGLHQSRDAAQSRGNADPRRGLRADGVSAVHQRRDPGGPGPRPAESAEGEDADRRQLRVATGLEAEDAAAKGLPAEVAKQKQQ